MDRLERSGHSTLCNMKGSYFPHLLNTEKCIPQIENIECLMESETVFVTVRRIDGVKLAPRPSPRTHEEQSQMTEHQATLHKNLRTYSRLHFQFAGFCGPHKCMS